MTASNPHPFEIASRLSPVTIGDFGFRFPPFHAFFQIQFTIPIVNLIDKTDTKYYYSYISLARSIRPTLSWNLISINHWNRDQSPLLFSPLTKGNTPEVGKSSISWSPNLLNIRCPLGAKLTYTRSSSQKSITHNSEPSANPLEENLAQAVSDGQTRASIRWSYTDGSFILHSSGCHLSE